MARINLPPLTRSFLAILIVLTILNTILQPNPSALSWFVRTGHGSPFLSLVPGQSFTYPWTLVTAAFVEQNIFGLIGTGLTIFFGGRYLERAWGFFEFAKFILIVCIVPNALCFGLYMVLYGASGSISALYVGIMSSLRWSNANDCRSTTISGGIAIQSAFLVAFKQLVPEHTVSILRGIIRMRVKHFPARLPAGEHDIRSCTRGPKLLCFSHGSPSLHHGRICDSTEPRHFLSSATGGDGPAVRGDASDTFAFAFFFPEPIHTPRRRPVKPSLQSSGCSKSLYTILGRRCGCRK